MSAKNVVTVTEYAKSRGVSRPAVYNAIKDGRIADAVVDGNKIDVDLADVLWAQNTNPDQGFHGHHKNRPAATTEDLERLAAQVGVDLSKIPSLADSKTLEAAYKAQLARLEYEEKSGDLISTEAVRKQAFKLARLTRDAMLAIPDRVSAEIAGITDAFEIHKKLMAEIRMAINEVSKEVEDEPSE